MSEKGMFLGPQDGLLYKRNNEMWVKIKSEDTGGTYEICEERCPPGFSSRRHMHTQDFETFYIVEGSAHWEVGGDEIDAMPGTFIHIPPNVPHKVQVGDDGCKMLCVFGPGDQSSMFAAMEGLSDEEKSDPAARKKVASQYNMVPLED